ncbi:glycosyl hydrolase [uncultured Fibrobacter sp.]|uniref:glycosyl hydrolase n=1 Tax=uncultured Fibrobacter sp. TaxID=261512 RepID=UPI0026297EBC|nr:glycosyl hydrolase [uncultured Fibrobacter sp.]
MMHKTFALTVATATFATLTFAATPIRLEAEDAVLANDHKVVVITDAKASGGKSVDMKDGDLEFKVTVPESGYYTLWATYQLPSNSTNKIQNLTVNDISAGQISFGISDEFTTIKGAGKIKLAAGENKIGIIHSWGYVNLDYIELTEYEASPWSISPTPVTPEPTESAQKLYNFLLTNFGKHVISGVMTERPFENDGQYTPQNYETQTELSYINKASGKNVVLVGFDFLHASGKNSDQQWYQGYTHASLEMAKTVWKAGGIPQFNWHWKDPMHEVEAFYTQSSRNDPYTEFSINKAYDESTGKWKTSSDEYKAIVRDMEMIADSLLTLQKEGVAVLWRPLHEASGKWFWWGTDGAKPCVALYKLMFDIFVNQKGLHNLIWVWTTDEASDALDWYPGDEYVDVVGRDYYYYPRESNHSSLIGSFETVKEIFGGKKIVALSENGSVPYPDEMKADGANWSWFMPWYGDYAMEGWANDNTAESWNTVMNNSYTLTLEDMPGWDNYEMETTIIAPAKIASPAIRLVGHDLQVNLNASTAKVSIFDMQGHQVMNRIVNGANACIKLNGIAAGQYIVKMQGNGFSQNTRIQVK